MFLVYWLNGWAHRAAWRLGLHTNGTAPTLATAWAVYGLTRHR